MTGDHHGLTAGTAILLVKDVDGILGTHRARTGAGGRGRNTKLVMRPGGTPLPT
jgi:hypothetical protein